MLVNIISLAVFLLCIYINYKRGFVKSILGFLSFFLAFIITFSFGSEFSEGFRETGTGKAMESKIYNITYESLCASDKADADEAIESLVLPGFIKKEAAERCRDFKSGIYDKISEFLSGRIFVLLCHIILFLALVLIFGVLKLIVPLIFKLPVLKQVNAFLGIGFGAVNGILWVWVLMLVISLLVNLGDWQWLKAAADESFVYNILYQQSGFLKLFL